MYIATPRAQYNINLNFPCVEVSPIVHAVKKMNPHHHNLECGVTSCLLQRTEAGSHVKQGKEKAALLGKQSMNRNWRVK